MNIPITIPDWIEKAISWETPLPHLNDRILLALEIASQNIQRGEGPFAAILFSQETHLPVAAGVNLVLQNQQSFMHAEITAILIAQHHFKTYDLSLQNLELVCSCEPCMMCLGGIYWSGVRGLAYSATTQHATAIGFDEGDKLLNWHTQAQKRGLHVRGPVLPEKGNALLTAYQEANGIIYSPSASR